MYSRSRLSAASINKENVAARSGGILCNGSNPNGVKEDPFQAGIDDEKAR